MKKKIVNPLFFEQTFLQEKYYQIVRYLARFKKKSFIFEFMVVK